MSDTNQIETALDAGKRLGGVGATPQRLSDGVPFVLLSDGLAAVDVEKFLPSPTRKRGSVAIRDAASFIEYVKSFAESSTLVFANIGDRTITAVVDYHEAKGSARWGQHRAVLTCLLTEDWKRWMAVNKKPMSQVDFAQFLEDNLPNIAEPAGGTIVEIAKTLEAKKSVNFASSIRLENGEHQLTYEETVTGSAQKGTVLIPSSFTLGLEPFEGAGLYRLDARFRYRIDSGVLKMWVDLIRPEAVVEDAFKKTRQQIADGIAPVKVIAASAPTLG
jgi:uncharacterized protein YfdQ (DUF2303 family)